MTNDPATISILMCRSQPSLGEEWVWGQRLGEEFFRNTEGHERVIVLGRERPGTVGEALAITQSDALGIVTDYHKLVWGPFGWDSLLQLLRRESHIAAVGPVTNETALPEQRMAPLFPYTTPSVLHCVCRAHYQQWCGQWKIVAALDPFAFLVRRSELLQLDATLPLPEIPSLLQHKQRSLAVALDTYVHRFPDVYEGARPDLQELVSREARTILDIGCAEGRLGAALKARQSCTVIGIESNPQLSTVAAEHLDQVLALDVETVAPDRFTAEFDYIICGELLEHLRDPWNAVKKFAGWLRPDGQLIATIPNVGHWSIVADLLHGRWELIPFGLLCWSHVRFFTRAGVEQLFRDSGLCIETLRNLIDPLPQVGETFVRNAASLDTQIDEESLRTHEFLIVGRKI